VSVGGDHGDRKGKENDTEWIILKHISSWYEDSMTKCTENFWLIEAEGNRERVSNRWGWSD
jgi:hypothetical protein